MGLLEGDKATIINSLINMKWRGREICRQFNSKNWACSSVDKLIDKYKQNGSYERTVERNRPVTFGAAINKEATRKTFLQFRKRLRAVVVNKGGPIQYLYR